MMIIPHTDGKGRIDGSPFWIKYNILPASKHTEEKIKGMVKDLKEAELVRFWKTETKEVLEIVNFAKHQKGLKQYPFSSFPEFPGISGNVREIPASRAPAEGEGEGEGEGEVNTFVPTRKISSGQEYIKVSKINYNFKTLQFENIPETQKKLWQSAYPAVNLDTAIAQAAAWAASNPHKKKSNWSRFLSNWLKHAQDRGGDKPAFSSFTKTADLPILEA